MKKPAIARAFVVILTAFLVIVSLFTAYAEEFDGSAQDNTVAQSYTDPSSYTESTDPSGSESSTTESIIPAKFPALTVNAISNFFPKSAAEYNANTKEITVTYWLHSTKNIMSVNERKLRGKGGGVEILNLVLMQILVQVLVGHQGLICSILLD